MRMSSTLRAIALPEAAKGALVLLVGFGVFALMHHDIQRLAERLIAHVHSNPAARYPRIFLDLAAQLTDSRLRLLAAGAVLYAVVQFIEAYRLWCARRWAEWFAALSGGVYIPFELVELYTRVTWLSLGAVTVNAAIVGIMLYGLLYATWRHSVEAD